MGPCWDLTSSQNPTTPDQSRQHKTQQVSGGAWPCSSTEGPSLYDCLGVTAQTPADEVVAAYAGMCLPPLHCIRSGVAQIWGREAFLGWRRASSVGGWVLRRPSDIASRCHPERQPQSIEQAVCAPVCPPTLPLQHDLDVPTGNT